MVRELYKMIHKKYYIAIILLLIIPSLFGIGYFFDLSYMMDGTEIADSAFDYCSEMQILIKYFYFLVVIYITCDNFSGEYEEGQLRMLLVHLNSRKKIILQKYGSLCILIFFVHMVFWIFNLGVYCISNIKNNEKILLAKKSMGIYFGIFWGYLEAFFLISAFALFMGLFLRKIYSLVLTYFVWFACRYVDQIINLKDVSTEFLADYLYYNTNNTIRLDSWCYIINAFICGFIIFISIYIFQQKDI